MKLRHFPIIQLPLISLIYLPSLISSQTCQKACGKQSIRYPFGTGPGCGDPRFQNHITCNQQELTFTTHTGSYPITSIDYANQVIYITDPSMSTCTCTKPSKGFGLDWNAPFSFNDNTVFALLDCSTTSPIYMPNGGNLNNSTSPLCDAQGASICSLLYSCQAVSRLNIPISTCCVYTPVDLGPSFEMDLQKLQCSSYSGINGFNDQEFNPGSWNYGMGLKYKFNYNNDYPTLCANCEKTNGVCGYSGPYNSFVCNCPGGLNTTVGCYFANSWSSASSVLPWQTSGALFICLLAWFFVMLYV